MRMRTVQGIGQTRRDPADCLDVRRLIEVTAIWALRTGRGGVAALQSVEDLEQMAAATRSGRNLGDFLEDSGQTGSSEVGHAERPQPPLRKGLLRKERD